MTVYMENYFQILLSHGCFMFPSTTLNSDFPHCSHCKYSLQRTARYSLWMGQFRHQMHYKYINPLGTCSAYSVKHAGQLTLRQLSYKLYKPCTNTPSDPVDIVRVLPLPSTETGLCHPSFISPTKCLLLLLYCASKLQKLYDIESQEQHISYKRKPVFKM